ncbi:unnamed protein product [Darwinula stevensoni]|uniref:Polyhydroxybutyrate depolymerase n=1 Tax=Darwinula stevensoni TaxID=69355 RepID=A0A7R8XBW9_9CRUS|nr:unnamed protein product [Darwinula stevensoni]CAG0891586.1 unnamed protein product [Darwinula stevensoni]
MLKGAIVLLVLASASAIRLGDLNVRVDPRKVTVSGLSSGGAMATQLHVALSSKIYGAAIFAGSPNARFNLPYYCADHHMFGGLTGATSCMYSPFLSDVNDMIDAARDFDSSGDIDPLDNMSTNRHKVYVFHGTADFTVNPDNGVDVETFYQEFLASSSDIMTEFSLASGHGFGYNRVDKSFVPSVPKPTDNPDANSCGATSSPYINDCNYHGAFESLNHLYGGGLEKPEGTVDLPGSLERFEQAEFFGGNPGSDSMADEGFVYVPSRCEAGEVVCKLHIPLHGCKQNEDSVDDAYVTMTGYLEVGELNNIVMLFPQTTSSGFDNPNACWDWWGYTDNNYLVRDGVQIDGISQMIDSIIN